MIFFACGPRLYPESWMGQSNIIMAYNAALQRVELLSAVTTFYLASVCALVCCRYDQTYPVNYMLLSTFTFCTGWIVCISTIQAPPLIVLQAAILTAAMVTSITVYAMTTKTDF